MGDSFRATFLLGHFKKKKRKAFPQIKYEKSNYSTNNIL